MFNINNIRELIASGYTVVVHNDSINIESDSPYELYEALTIDDTSEIWIGTDGKYQGGAVITKDMGEVDLMCTHELTTTIVDTILRRTSPIKPLVWEEDTEWKLSDPYFTAVSLRFVYTVSGKRGGDYKVAVGDMVNDTNELRPEIFNNLQQAILWAEKHHKLNMRDYVYGI